MVYKSGPIFLPFYQGSRVCDGRTDRQTDRIFIAIPRLHYMQRGKNAKRPFSCKIALCLKKVCYKVSLFENCQRQSCKAFIGLIILTIRAKMIGGGRPLLSENLADTDQPPWKMPIFDLFSPVAPQPSHLAKKFN